ncbi:MAG: DNA polymerase I [Omnitrophica WOR_2 bacterium RIFCSPHIGHO2_02_FULL_67_20]|nr:MAG: DNA polymerase I [Omnitrophica WOR_2 bacterium RIFCSPHIGHO2_02_FULL_67_20]
MTLRKVFLIDGTAFCYRAFYAIRLLSTADGRATNAVYGFARMLQSLREKERPDYLAVAFDVGKPTFRHRQFEAYKVQRKPMPDALIAQLPLVKTLLAAYRVPVFEQEGFEGEDVLATITHALARPGLQVFLVTGDKDALQLVNSHVLVYNPHKKDDPVLDAEAVRARYGVGPEQMVDLMALMGDEIDNIPGVPGIGEKTATELIQRFGSVETLYRRLEEVEPPARRQSLERSREQVGLAHELARIRTDVPFSVALEDLAPREPDWRALRQLFRDLEFKQLLAGVDGEAPPSSRPAVTVRPLATAGDVDAWLSACRGKPAALGCWPVEPRPAIHRGPGASPADSGASRGIEAVILALAVEAGDAWVDRFDRDAFQGAVGKRLAAWLADAKAAKIGHDAKLAKRRLGRLGAVLEGVSGDTMLAAYLLNPARTNQTLSDLADEHLGAPLSALPKTEHYTQRLVDTEPPREPFGAHASAVLELHGRLLPKLDSAGLTALYLELELPLLNVLAAMEANGIALDVPYLQGLSASMSARLARLTEELYQLAGVTFNLNSPKQLGQVLFERLGLRVIKRTKTGPSTDSDVLQQLAAEHPVPQKLLQYRELSKLVSTYVDALPKLVDPETKRLHTSFNQAATATGRLSSSEPNLQNIPIKTELGRSIRKAFTPGLSDGVLLAADYTQIELRILAHLSGDDDLASAFREDRDIHRFTASLIYGLPEAEVQPEQRNAMKAINYGILYGMTAHGLSKELGISYEEAQAFIDAYFQRYPKVRSFRDAQVEQARRDGFVQTLLGRRRYIPEINSPDPMIRQFGERMAVNAPVQGTAADLIKRAMVQLAAALGEQRLASRMVLQVHDELVFEAPGAELTALALLVRRVMEGAIRLDVPLTVTLKAGPNWLELSEVK